MSHSLLTSGVSDVLGATIRPRCWLLGLQAVIGLPAHAVNTCTAISSGKRGVCSCVDMGAATLRSPHADLGNTGAQWLLSILEAEQDGAGEVSQPGCDRVPVRPASCRGPTLSIHALMSSGRGHNLHPMMHCSKPIKLPLMR